MLIYNFDFIGYNSFLLLVQIWMGLGGHSDRDSIVLATETYKN